MSKKMSILSAFFAFYAAGVVVQNILATKQIDLWIFTLAAGILITPLVFIIQDVVTEVFGYKTGKRMVITGFAVNAVAALLYAIAVAIPPAKTWGNQAAFEAILGSTIRITLASLAAYFVGSLANTKIMAKMKKEKGIFFVRAVFSTFIGQFLDDLIFIFGAFYGTLPVKTLVAMVAAGVLCETLYEIVIFPVTKKVTEKVGEEVIENES